VSHHDRSRFVIAAHHPDRLRRPQHAAANAHDERFHQALTWNVFRTLELVTPSFWLRRFHVRMTSEPSLVAPQMCRVRLWQRLPLPPIQRIDGDRRSALADVVIETEHDVWTLLVATAADGADESDRAASVVDAGAWRAGARQHHCGVIESAAGGPGLGSLLQARYARSRESTRLRSVTRGPATPSPVAWTAIGWPDMAAVLEECGNASNLPPIERSLARNALDWLDAAGIGVRRSNP
jgi:hypothetical protein